MKTLPIDKIIVGRRHRRDLGNLDGLKASIQDLGLLQPVVITSKGELIAGRRRLEACKALGWKTIPIHVVSLKEIARGEHDENVHRKDFLPTELVAIRRALEPEERKAAKTRIREGGRRGGQGSGKLPEASTGTSRDKIAQALGIGGRTLDKATAVVEAAEQDPERYGDLPGEMDETGKVDPIWRKMHRRARVDVSWQHEWKGMPEFSQEDLTPCKQVIVNFATEADVKLFGELIGQDIPLGTKSSIWYPDVENDHAMARWRFVDEGES